MEKYITALEQSIWKSLEKYVARGGGGGSETEERPRKLFSKKVVGGTKDIVTLCMKALEMFERDWI